MDDSSHTDGSGDESHFRTDRRQFLQAAGIGVAGISGLGGLTAAAQIGSDTVIELEAVSIDTSGSGAGRSEYAWEDGTGGIVRGPPAAVCDAQGGSHVWMGAAPGDIAGVTNPTLDLVAGETYTVEVTNVDGEDHDFVIVDGDGNEVLSEEVPDDEGGTTSFSFEATEEMAEYYCSTHSTSQRGQVDVGDAVEPPDEVLEVLYLGGVEDAATHYTEDLLKVLAPTMLQHGIRLHYTERQADLNADTLGDYDAVMIYGNRYDGTEEQINALVDFVENGGGFVPVHAASFCFNTSDAYISLVGGMFDTHPPIQSTTTDRQAPDHPVFDGVDVFSSDEEPYHHTNVADDITVLEYGAGSGFSEDENEPWTWTRTQGDGRVFYTAWGHSSVWEVPDFQQLLVNGILWTTGNEDTIGSRPAAPEKTYTNVSEYGEEYIPNPGRETPDAVSSADDGVWDLVQDPFPVAESMAHTITPAAFELEYFVSEDIYPDGVEGEILDFTFDAAGRCWLSVTQDYPNDVGAGNDLLLIAEDTDGDGMADDFTVFTENLSIPHSLLPHEDGVIVAEVGTDQSGRVVYFGDEDGDDVADTENVIFTGYGTGDTHAGLNQLYRGHDNWIYGVVGYEGLSPSIDDDLSLSQDLFRFRPDGSEIEFVGSGASNMAGVKTNEEGLVFCSSATAGEHVTSYAAIPAAYYDYINGFEGATTVDIRSETNLSRTDDENRVLPINDRYRAWDRQGGFTAATDQEIYTAREFPQQYWNNTTFVSEGTAQLTSTFYLEQTGASYEANYYHNLLASNDEWVSPTYVNTGPDGMAWAIDMYDFIFQHNPTPQGYETGAGNAYETDVRDDEHSRLYRVTTGGDVDAHGMDLSDASASELVDALAEDNMFWRQTAQRKLIEMDAQGVVPDLVSMATSEDVDAVGIDGGSIHALWTLEGLGAVEANASALVDALTHASAGVRLNALRVLPATAAVRDAILNEDLLNDEDGRVQMWALLTLAETPESDAAGEAIYQMISQEANYSQQILADAASIAGATHADGFIAAYEANEDTTDPDPGEQPNLLTNPSFEETETTAGPDEWELHTWQGTADFEWVEGTANTGDYSVRISSDEGADAVWRTTVSVEEDTDYTLSGYVKTENVETLDDTGSSDITPFGAVLNVDQVGGASDGDVVTDPLTGTNDWTEVSVTFNSGSNTELTVNGLFGGFGHATGTAWFDDLSLVDPAGNELLPNTSFESGTTSTELVGWVRNTWGGTAEHTHTTERAHDGDHSVTVSSDAENGADAGWSQTVTGLEPYSEYTFSVWVQAENLEVLPTDRTDFGTSYGVALNNNTQHQETIGDYVQEDTDGWTKIESVFPIGDMEELGVNMLFGGYGNATGTVWYDDAQFVKTGGFGGNLSLIYERVTRHVELETGPTAAFSASSSSVLVGEEVSFDASTSSTPDGSITSYEWDFGDESTGTGQTTSHTYESAGEYTVELTVTTDGGATDTTSTTVTVNEEPGLDPSQTIELEAQSNAAWTGVAPASIEGENPTLELREGETYTVEWTNVNGMGHNFEILDADSPSADVVNGISSDIMSNQGETQTIEFEATAEMARYQCFPHQTSMQGDIEIV